MCGVACGGGRGNGAETVEEPEERNSADPLSATSRDDVASAGESHARAVPQVLGNRISVLRGLQLQTSDGQ
jgi:hypothetical protein